MFEMMLVGGAAQAAHVIGDRLFAVREAIDVSCPPSGT